MDRKNAGDEGAALLTDFATDGDVESDYLRGGLYPPTVAQFPGEENRNDNGFVDLDVNGDMQLPLSIYGKDEDIRLRLVCIFACQMAELYQEGNGKDAFLQKISRLDWMDKNPSKVAPMITILLSTFNEGYSFPAIIADFNNIPISVLPYVKEHLLLKFVERHGGHTDSINCAENIRDLFDIACSNDFNRMASQLICEPRLIIPGFDLREVDQKAIKALAGKFTIINTEPLINYLCAKETERQYNVLVKPRITEAFMQYASRDGGCLSTKEYYDKFCNFMATTIFLIFGSMSLKFILDITTFKPLVILLSILFGLPSATANRAIAKQVLYGLQFTRKAEKAIGEAIKQRNINEDANVNDHANNWSCENILYSIVSRLISFYREFIGLLSAMIVSISYWSSTSDGFDDVSTSLGLGVIPEGWNYCLPTIAFSFRCFFMVEALARQKLEYEISPYGKKQVKKLSKCFKNIDNEKGDIPDWLSLLIKQFFYKKIKQERMSLKSAVKWDLYFFCYNIACVYYSSFVVPVSNVMHLFGLDINGTEFVDTSLYDVIQKDAGNYCFQKEYNYRPSISIAIGLVYLYICSKMVPSFTAWLPNDCFESSGAACVAERGVLGRALISSKLISGLAIAAGQGAAISSSQQADNFAYFDWRFLANNLFNMDSFNLFGLGSLVKYITIILNFYLVYALNLVPLLNQIAGLVFDMVLNEEKNTRIYKLQRKFTGFLVGKNSLAQLANPDNLSFNAALKRFRNTKVGRFLKYDETCCFNPRSAQYTTPAESPIKQEFCDVINAINAMNGLYRITHPFNRLLLEGLIDKYETQVKLLYKEFGTEEEIIDQEAMEALGEIIEALYAAKRVVDSFLSGSEITAKRVEFDREKKIFENKTNSNAAACENMDGDMSPDLSDNEGDTHSRGTSATPPPGLRGRATRLPVSSPFHSSSPDTPNRGLGSNSFGDSDVKPSALRARTVTLDPLDPKAPLDLIEGGLAVQRKAGAFLTLDSRRGDGVHSSGTISPVARQRRPTLQAQVKTGDDENQSLRLDGSSSPYSVVSDRGSVNSNSPVHDRNFSPRGI